MITVDYFGDLDQKRLVENHSLKRDFELPYSVEALLAAGRDIDAEKAVYVANLENHPAAVAQIASERTLLGNGETTLRKVRNWDVLRRTCIDLAIPCATTLMPGEENQADRSRFWLQKPLRSGSGHGIEVWDGKRLETEQVLQQYLTGLPISACVVANGRQSVVIGLTEQLIGKPELGVNGFRWCGNILPAEIPTGTTAPVLDKIEDMAAQLTRKFELQGVFGLDLVLCETPTGELAPYLIEVNPRFTASMELVELAYDRNIFSLHVAACAGTLPDFCLRERLDRQPHYVGKGIVFANHEVRIQDVSGWAELGRKDIPYPGERINAGHPICSILSQGATRNMCWTDLVIKTGYLRDEIGDVV